MNKLDVLEIGLALNNIGMVLDDETFERVKPYLDKIEAIVLKVSEHDK